jgi:hypothetical protein
VVGFGSVSPRYRFWFPVTSFEFGARGFLFAAGLSLGRSSLSLHAEDFPSPSGFSRLRFLFPAPGVMVCASRCDRPNFRSSVDSRPVIRSVWVLALACHTGIFPPGLISLPCYKVRSSLISSVSAALVCYSRPSLLARDFPSRRGRAQARPRVRVGCPSSSFLHPCQVFASTSRFRVALCFICLPADLMSMLL